MHSAHDPVGAASARLLGAGVERHDRLYALRVLGLLLDHADGRGVVRVHPATLAAEFALDRVHVEAAYLRLRAAGVLQPTPDGWRIDEFDGYQPGGVNAGDALALIADLLEGPLADAAPASAASVAPAARRLPAFAVVALLLLAVAAAARPRDPGMALRMAGAIHAEEAHTVETAADDEEPAPTMLTRVARRAPAPDPFPVPGPALASAPPTTAPATATTSADAATAVAEAASPIPCPAGGPAVLVDEVDALTIPAQGLTTTLGAGPVDGQAAWRITVRGIAANPTDRSLVLEAFDVVITTDDGEQVVEVLEEPLLLAAGAEHPWEVVTSTPLPSPPPDDDDVAAVVRSWRWTAGCASSALQPSD